MSIKNDITSAHSNSNHPQNDMRYYSNTLYSKIYASGIIWLSIGIIQCISVIFALAGLINIYLAVKSLLNAKNIRTPYYGMIEDLTVSTGSLVFFFVWNLIFGGVIGIAGSIYDLTTQLYILRNAHIFNDNINAKYNSVPNNMAYLYISYEKNSEPAVSPHTIEISGMGCYFKQTLYNVSNVNDLMLAKGTYTLQHYCNGNVLDSINIELNSHKVVSIRGEKLQERNI